MVLVEDKKFACETCIKGHRSSACQHTDRPLFEIKKKGRPVTQCEHCRELRKTKQVHVKCLCESREDLETQPSHSIPAKKANRTGIVVSAAFPNGLPNTASSSSAVSSSQANSSTQRTSVPCTCKVGGSCHCCTPRRSQKSPREDNGSVSASRTSTPPKSRMSHMRPIAPSGPSYSGAPSGEDYLASVSAGSSSSDLFASQSQLHGHPSRSTHGSALYSPYGSPHERMTGSVSPSQYLPPELLSGMQSLQVPPQGFGTLPNSPSPSLNPTQTRSASGSPGQWSEDEREATMDFWRSLCQCGDNCACPGCFQHGNDQRHPRGGVLPSPQTCINPERCQSCFNCTAETLRRSLAQGPTLDQFALDPALEAPTFGTGARTNMDMQSYYSNGTANAGGSSSDFSMSMGYLPQMLGSAATFIDPLAYGGSMPQQALASSPSSIPQAQAQPRCRLCPPGQCSCSPNERNRDHTEDSRTYGQERPLTFATSGERASCCGGGPSGGSRLQSHAQSHSRGSSSSQPFGTQSGSSSSSNMGQRGMPSGPQRSSFGSSIAAPFPISLPPSSQFPSFGTSTSTYLAVGNMPSSVIRTPSADSHSDSSGDSNRGSRRGSASDSNSSGSGRKLVRAILPKGPVVFPDYD